MDTPRHIIESYPVDATAEAERSASGRGRGTIVRVSHKNGSYTVISFDHFDVLSSPWEKESINSPSS
jgi:hypothetical protein